MKRAFVLCSSLLASHTCTMEYNAAFTEAYREYYKRVTKVARFMLYLKKPINGWNVQVSDTTTAAKRINCLSPKK